MSTGDFYEIPPSRQLIFAFLCLVSAFSDDCWCPKVITFEVLFTVPPTNLRATFILRFSGSLIVQIELSSTTLIHG